MCSVVWNTSQMQAFALAELWRVIGHVRPEGQQ